MCDTFELSLIDCKSALIALLNAFQSAGEISARLENARAEAGNDMVKQMQLVFPLVTQIQSDVISRYGFSKDGEGVIQFLQHVKFYEQKDPEVYRLHHLVKAYFIPPIQTR